jgi:hypothetical protein
MGALVAAGLLQPESPNPKPYEPGESNDYFLGYARVELVAHYFFVGDKLAKLLVKRNVVLNTSGSRGTGWDGFSLVWGGCF